MSDNETDSIVTVSESSEIEIGEVNERVSDEESDEGSDGGGDGGGDGVSEGEGGSERVRELPNKSDDNFWLNTDDEDEMSWIFKVPWVNVEAACVQTTHVDLHSEKHKFKIGMYSVLARLNRGGLAVYMGLNQPFLLSPSYKLNCRYQVSLCLYTDEAKEDYTLQQLMEDEKLFQREYSGNRILDLVDHGRNVMELDNLIRLKDRIVDNEGYFSLLCKISAFPLPVAVQANHDSKEETGMVGLENLGATCYLNALLQMLYHVNAFRNAVFQTPYEGEELKTSITLAMQSVFNQLQTRSKVVSTTDLTRAFGWDSLEAFQQQDVQEMLRVLLDKMEECMRGKGPNVDGVVKSLFAGKIKSYIRCVNIDYESAREEEFYDIQLDVKGCSNVYESFKKYSEKEMLSGENQYDAGEDENGNPRGKQDAEKGVVFTELPPVLTIHLKRFEFDMQLMGFSKIHDRYEFPMRLELDSFVEPQSSPAAAGVDDEGGNIKPLNNFILHSVLIHAGDVYGGHYYAYIRPSIGDFWQNVSEVNRDVDAAINSESGLRSDLGRGGEWFKFDDDFVSKVDRREAVEGSYGSAGATFLRRSYHSAYMLVYIRESDACRTMADVAIPDALTTRLNKEYLRNIEAERQLEIQSLFTEVRYVIKDDLTDFASYTRHCDFFIPEESRKLKIMKKTMLGGYLMAFSEILDVRVDRIRLWHIGRADDHDVWRIDDKLDLRRCGFDPLVGYGGKKHIFYVEVLPNTVDLNFVDCLDTLKKFERTWLESCRNAIDDVVGDTGYDRTAGCGVCKGNLPILKYLPDGSIKMKLLIDYNEQNDFFHRILLKSKSYVENDDVNFMLIVKYLNINFAGEIQEPVVMKNVWVQGVNDSHTTYNDIKRIAMAAVTNEIVRNVENGDWSEDESIAFQNIWRRGELIKVMSPTDLDRCPRSVGHVPLSHQDALQCGDIVCLVPVPYLGNGDDSTDDIASNDDEISPYVSELISYLRSIVLTQDMNVKPRQRIHVPHYDILNRRTGLWCCARSLFSLGDAEIDGFDELNEAIPEGGVSVSVNEDFNSHEMLNAVDGAIMYGDPSRLRIGTIIEQGYRVSKYVAVQDDFFKRSDHLTEDILVEALPFPSKLVDQEISSCKYYEVFLIGANLKSIRQEWLDNVMLPCARDLYKKQILAGVNNVFHLKRVFDYLPWTEGVDRIPDEYLSVGKCYFTIDMPSDQSEKFSFTVHDLVQQFRKNMGLSLSSSDRIPGPSSSGMFGKKRSAEGAGLHAGGRDAVDKDTESLTLAKNDSTPEGVSTTENQVNTVKSKLTHLLKYAEYVHAEDGDIDRIMMYNVRNGKISKFLCAETEVSCLPKSWVEDAICSVATRTTSPQPLCAQFVCPEELLFFTASHPSVRSMPISVFSFEFSMQVARPRNRLSEVEAGPFISYLREDDTYDTLVARLADQVGDDTTTDWDKMRLAIVTNDQKPHFIPRQTPSSPRTSNALQNEASEALITEIGVPTGEGKDDTSTVWDLFLKYFPVVANLDATCQPEAFDCSVLPLLGLQHPTADQSSKSKKGNVSSNRGVRRVNSGIKIN